MTPSTIKSLRELAEKATPGPWSTFFEDLRFCANDVQAKDKAGDSYVMAQMNRHFENWKEDGNYIAAANPQTILSLLDYVEGLEDKLDSLEFDNEKLRDEINDSDAFTPTPKDDK